MALQWIFDNLMSGCNATMHSINKVITLTNVYFVFIGSYHEKSIALTFRLQKTKKIARLTLTCVCRQ